MEQFDFSLLDQAMPNKKAMYYDILSDEKGYYLPKWNSSVISEPYLLQVARHQVFYLKKEDVIKGTLGKRTKIPELIKALEENSKLPLGFRKCSIPDKQWLVNCLHTICPQHSFFQLELQDYLMQHACEVPEKPSHDSEQLMKKNNESFALKITDKQVQSLITQQNQTGDFSQREIHLISREIKWLEYAIKQQQERIEKYKKLVSHVLSSQTESQDDEFEEWYQNEKQQEQVQEKETFLSPPQLEKHNGYEFCEEKDQWEEVQTLSPQTEIEIEEEKEVEIVSVASRNQMDIEKLKY